MVHAEGKRPDIMDWRGSVLNVTRSTTVKNGKYNMLLLHITDRDLADFGGGGFMLFGCAALLLIAFYFVHSWFTDRKKK